MKRVTTLAVVFAVFATTAAAQHAGLDSARANLAKYKDPFVALANGYLSTVACIDFAIPGKVGETDYRPGAMGVHFINPGLIGKPLDPAMPTVLMYEPHGDTLELVGAEWFVPVEVSPERPTLFGRPLDGPMDGHAPIMPASLKHYDLHVWLWRTNPAGVYSPTNSAVRCPKSPLTHTEGHAHN
jgi:hypothetical protein